jgi:hypothetical protein
MSLSSDFTNLDPGATVPPPPLIGALLRIPFETVRDRMLDGLHERGYTDLVAAHLDVFQYPGPENQRPSELAIQTRMSKQALNYLLGQLEQLGYLTRETDPNDHRSKRVREVEAEWERQLGPRKFAQLRELLTQLHATTADHRS